MMNPNLYASALSQCQLGLSQIRDDSQEPLKPGQIEEEVDEVLSMRRFRDGVDRERLIKELEEIFTIWSDTPTALENNDDHLPWLRQRSGDIQWKFWNRYKLYLLQRQKLSPIALENVEKVTDEVLARIEDPARDGPWDRRGLVMGDVQSGKTGTYIGLICKAADAGYKVIVVLAGLHNNLRSQTQIRLDEGFLGYKAAPPTSGDMTATFEATGVAEFGGGLKADSITNRHENGDFNRGIARHFALHPGGNPLLFVVKKNVSVLRHLLAYIHSRADASDPETGRRFHRETPLLVIDDEADQASVDTKQMKYDEYGKPDEEHDPTKTNRLIRSLLHSFDKSAYVGFTATPFANIFIHESAKSQDIGEDLFPRSFIVNLPAPSNYVGASRIFGIDEDKDVGLAGVEPLPLTRIIKDHAKSAKHDESEGWMPPKLLDKTEHVPTLDGKRIVPPSLGKAIKSFLISSAVRAIREEAPIFNSMLVHVVRFTNVQNIVKEQVEDELSSIVDRLVLGDGARRPTVMDEFEELWKEDYLPTTEKIGLPYRLPDWSEVAKILPRVAKSVEVKAINGSAGDALEYEEHKETGLNIIAIGGDKLSRGLTLDGLVVSYFLRSSRMYDTLMQMGRWFGYREKYIDVCRMYITSDLESWFKHIAGATEELRQEFDYMVSVGASPRAYGLKVRSHPTLLVTSAAKMRTGTKMQLSYSGDISETILFDKRGEVAIKRNFSAVKNLIDKMGRQSSGQRAGGYLWGGVDAPLILDFLADYVTHQDAIRANSALLSRYIRKQNDKGELKTWTVKLVSSRDAKGGGIYNDLLKGESVGANKRSPHPIDEQREDRYSIRRLVNPADELDDLNKDEFAIALKHTHYLWENNQRKNKPEEKPDKPSGPGIRYARPKERGLLLIYPLDPAEAELPQSEIPIMGFAISFPRSDTAEPISYTVTNLFAQYGDYGDI